MGHEREGQGGWPASDGAMTLSDLARVRGILTHAPVRMGLIVAVVAAAFGAWNLSSTPTYKSSVKLRVDDVTARSPQVEHRSIPTGTVDEGEALTALGSRTLLAEVVSPRDEDHPHGLGLTTWVTDESAPPLRRILRGAVFPFHPGFRVEAQARRTEASSPAAVRVRFLSDSEISVSRIGPRPGVEWPEDHRQTFELKPGEPVVYEGLEIHLAHTGSPDGRVWRVESLSEDQAIDRVKSRLRIDKQQHQTGTLGISILDDDPVRAAALANSLANAFVTRDLSDSRSRAMETVRFLEGELNTRRDALLELRTTEAELHGQNPDTIHPDASALELATREGVWDDLHRKARARRIMADRVELMIASGRSVQSALAALGGETAPEIRSLMEALSAEEDESRKIHRGSKDSGYRKTLLLKADDYRLEAEVFRTRVEDLENIVADLEAGNETALSRLGGDLARDGSVAVDWNIRLWITELEATRSDLERLEAEFTEAYPPLAAARERMRYFSSRIIGGLKSLLEGHQATLLQKEEYAASWTALHAAYPETEAALIQASIAQIEKELIAAFSAWASSLRVAETAAEAEVARLQERRKELASSKHRLAATLLESRELDAVVGELVRDVENARVAAAGILPSARIIDPAVVPRTALKPRAAFGLVAGLLLGLLLALAWAWFDVQRREGPATAAQVASQREELLICGRVAVTGPAGGEARSLTLMREAGDQSLWIPMMADPESLAAQTYRTLRARLRSQLTPEGHGPKLIGLTGARPLEGTSTVAINLAMARAQLGERVLLVDAHLSRPALHRALDAAGLESEDALGDETMDHLSAGGRLGGANRRRGLGQCLDGSAHWSEVAAPTGFPGLDLLQAGSSSVVTTDLLASQMFDVFCDEAREVYDLVLVDLAPMNEVPDAEAAARALDGVLFVTSEVLGPLSAATVRDCTERIDEAGGHVIGQVKTIAMERRGAAVATAPSGLTSPKSPRRAG